MVTLNAIEQELANIALPLKTHSYTPIPHMDFIENMQENLENSGYAITNKHYWHNQSGTQLVGRYTLNFTDNDIAMNIGFKNSYDKSMSAGFALGATVIVCGNGMVRGEFAVKRKHIGNAAQDIEEFMIRSIGESADNFYKLISMRDAMKNMVLSKRTINELIGRLVFEDEIIKHEQLSIIKQEYNAETPTFDYGVFKDSPWNIYNLCTYAIDKKSHPMTHFKQHTELLNTFQEVLLL